jgi:hypothetical protein
MRLLWVLLAVALIGGIYLYQNPDFRTRVEDLSSGAGLSKKTTHVYKWQNDAGEWQITDQLPPEGTDYETLDYHEDVNVLPLPPQLGGEP